MRYRTIKLFSLILLCLSPALGQATDLSILSYNVYLRSPAWVFRNDHTWRAGRISSHLKGYDAVVLQEAFSDEHRDLIVEALIEEYPYNTGKFGDDEFFSYNGGIIILSRWPIIARDRLFFEGCEGSDCMVKKGVAYISFEKEGQNIHLFGLHLQAQKEYARSRVNQFPQLLAFIEKQQISPSELTLIAGDFNVDFYSDKIDKEYSRLTTLVGLGFPEENPLPTYDQKTNKYVEDAVTERLDFIFYSTRHLVPAVRHNAVKYIRSDGIDLSDHHAVEGLFSFNPDIPSGPAP